MEGTSPSEHLEQYLKSIDAEPVNDAPDAAPAAALKAVRLARHLQERGTELQTPQEKKQQVELELMMQSPGDKATLTQMTDQAFRSSDPSRAVDQLTHILDVQGVPRFFTTLERTLLRGFQSFGSYLPGVAVPLVKDKMRAETANVILPAERELLTEHLDARRSEDVRMNVNFLGEALLGEREAEKRLQAYLEALQFDELEVLSVKVSTIYSQISTLAYDNTMRRLCDRLELLYRAAAKGRFVRMNGTSVPKFVYLDMEEYRDLHITADAFMRTLDRPGLETISAGIALQAYVPDSYKVQQEINAWARRRVEAGGAPVTIRLVKGANLEMERVEASLHGWPQAPFRTKLEVDANYKRMLHEALRPENLEAVRIGIASHNLFDIAYGLICILEANALDSFQFEMLEGMANHQRRALRELTNHLLLYAPATRREDFIHAIGYLIRRLDENTGPDNFLRHAFKIQVDSEDWRKLERQFLQSFELIDELRDTPRRTQDRRVNPEPTSIDANASLESYEGEPDTDFSLSHNVAWAEDILATWQDRCGENAIEMRLSIDGEPVDGERVIRECHDPSRPGVVVGRYQQATEEDMLRAIAAAKADSSGWRERSHVERSEILGRVAHELRCARADLIGAAVADGGKTVIEADPEVSEAVDFLEFYRRSAEEIATRENLVMRGKGVVAVIPPWNFPIAIPCGGVAAALAAGNTVILKPASETVLVAHVLCQAFWRAGVPESALQLVPCAAREVGSKLVAHPDVDTVILTGGTDTAFTMLGLRADIHLLAETGGKNATVVTALADREQAIKNVVRSAFGHSGQKCSATSLLILEAEVYDDEEFKESLCDAVNSLAVGSAWDVRTKIGPMVRPPSGALETALKELEEGESWAVRPRRVGDNPCLYSPAVKWGVTPGSFTHTTEFFGPILGVMRARDLDEAIRFVNQTGYGLTSGIESLDDRERRHWRDSVRAGNLYINRGTTGAIVLRQPFGGMGKSAFGPGIKVGGPNYLAQFVDIGECADPPMSTELADERLEQLRQDLVGAVGELTDPERNEAARAVVAMCSYDWCAQREFLLEHDHFKLVGEDNIRRYLPVEHLRIRLHAQDSLFDLFARVAAARTVGCRITISLPPGLNSPGVELLESLTESWGAANRVCRRIRRRTRRGDPHWPNRPRSLRGSFASPRCGLRGRPGHGIVRGPLTGCQRWPHRAALVRHRAEHQL